MQNILIKVIAFSWVFGEHVVIACDLCSHAGSILIEIWSIFEQVDRYFHFALEPINYVASLLSSSSKCWVPDCSSFKLNWDPHRKVVKFKDQCLSRGPFQTHIEVGSGNYHRTKCKNKENLISPSKWKVKKLGERI